MSDTDQTTSPAPESAGARPLSGRIALVTGATRGLGRAVALALAHAGAHVIATGRRAPALEKLDDEIKAATGSAATLIPLDLRVMEKVDELGPALFARFGRLDILIANAGQLGPLSPLGHIKEAEWQMVMDVNLNANWRLVRTLDPLLKRSDAARAVFVSSGAAQGKYAYWGPYAVTKAGLEALAKTYARECENEPVKVNIVNPGPLRTDMRAKAFPGEDPMTLPAPEAIAPLFVDLSLPSCPLNGAVIDGRTWLEAGDLAQAAH